MAAREAKVRPAQRDVWAPVKYSSHQLLAPCTFSGTVTLKKPWKGCPDPRGSHSGSLIGNSLVVFGGYGGPGFSRRDFNDVYVSAKRNGRVLAGT